MVALRGDRYAFSSEHEDLAQEARGNHIVNHLRHVHVRELEALSGKCFMKDLELGQETTVLLRSSDAGRKNR